MTSKTAERLLVLNDTGAGLLARAFNLCSSQFKVPKSWSPELEKVGKLLGKKFPDHPPDLERTAGFDVFKSRARDLETDFASYYYTFVQVLDFNDAAVRLLRELSQSILTLDMNTNPDLLRLLFRLLCTVVRLPILLTRAYEMKMCLSLYAKAYHLVFGNTQPEFERIRVFVEQYQNPIAKLREDLDPELHILVGPSLNKLLLYLAKWAESRSILNNKVFNLLDEPQHMTVPHGTENHLELLDLAEIRNFVLLGFLVTPSSFVTNTDMGLQVLQQCLQQSFLIPVFRSEVLDVHKEYDDMFSSFKKDKFKLSKHNKILKECRSNGSEVANRHFEVRKFLRLELGTMESFFEEFPGLVAPKFKHILAAIGYARDEVVWYFNHLSLQWGSKVKNVPKKEEFNDPDITYLIHSIFRLSDLIERHTGVIQEYYLQVVHGKDYDEVRPIADKFISSGNIATDMTTLLNDLLSALKSSTVQTDFDQIRLLWYRLSTSISGKSSGVNTTISSPLVSALDRVINHTRNIDRVWALLAEHASLRDLFFYTKEIEDLLRSSLQSPHGHARHCLSIVRTLGHSVDNIHRVAYEEQIDIGIVAVNRTVEWFKLIFSSLDGTLHGLIQQTTTLRDQVAPVEALNRALRDKQSTGYPGFESMYNYRAYIVNVSSAKRIIADVGAAFNETERVAVFNMCYFPREYMIDFITAMFKASLARSIINEANRPHPPTVMIGQLRVLIGVFEYLQHFVNINMRLIVRNVLASELSDFRAGGPGEPLKPIEGKSDGKSSTLLEGLCKMYLGVFSTPVETWGVTFSELTQGYTNVPDSRTYRRNSQAGFQADRYADKTELRALMRMIGPGGARFFDVQILDLVKQLMGQVKLCLDRNYSVLNEMRNRFFEINFWTDKVRTLQGLDELTKNSIVIGQLLKFRQMQRTALQEASASREGIPSIFDAVVPFTTQKGVLPEMDFLADDFGLSSGADPAFLSVLREVVGDSDRFSYLPELYAAAFFSTPFHRLKYLIATQSYENNVNVLTTAIKTMITGYQELKGANREKEIQSDLERFLRCACLSILHISKHKNDNVSPFTQFKDVPAMMVFVELFTVEAPNLNLRLLEDFFPYTLLRANYIQMYERQSVKGRSYAAVQEDEQQ